MKNKKGFTLIELLIVIGILAVLAITVLLALNPAEAQRKTRDVARDKDLGTLQTIVDQYINDNPTSQFAVGTSVTSLASRDCAASWMGVDVCGYTQLSPIDPNAGSSRAIATGGPSQGPAVPMNYRVRTANGTYRICVRQESVSNNPKLLGDGGVGTNANAWVETGSDLTGTLDCGA